jgi:N-acetylglucosamine-6-sulfatase
MLPITRPTLLVLVLALCPAAISGGRPNIVFILSDDHAVQAISSYGGRLATVAPTPNIDRLASEGALFENSFCANSICGPSRATILTGKLSHLNGFLDNNTSRFDASQVTFPKLLQQAGYNTALIGKWHLKSIPQGFDHWEILPGQGNYYNPDFIQMDRSQIQRSGYVTDIVTDLAIEWLEAAGDTNQPFVLMCQQKAPHRNWAPALRHLTLFDNVQIPEPETLFDDYANRSAALKEQEMTAPRVFQERCFQPGVRAHDPAAEDGVGCRLRTEEPGLHHLGQTSETRSGGYHPMEISALYEGLPALYPRIG